MKYIVKNVDVKNDDWKLIGIEDSTSKTTSEVSVNRKSKKGELFPNFDEIKVDAEIEGELWQSQAGKFYLFAPKPQTSSSGGSKSAFVEKTMARKEESIGRFQDKKEEAIALSSAQRDAVLIVTARGLDAMTVDDIKSEILQWRNWFLSDGFTEHPPF